MKGKDIFTALGGIDPEFILDAAPGAAKKELQEDVESIKNQKRAVILDKENAVPKKKTSIKKICSIAASVILLVCTLISSVPLYNFMCVEKEVFVNYSSFEDMYKEVSKQGLYSNISRGNTENQKITVVYKKEKGKNTDTDSPIRLTVEQTYSYSTHTDEVSYHVFFEETDIEKSTVEGYEEQGLYGEVYGLTVHYSFSGGEGELRTQAKFVYGEDLYVIDIKNGGEEHELVPYLELLVGDISKEEETQFIGNIEDLFAIKYIRSNIGMTTEYNTYGKYVYCNHSTFSDNKKPFDPSNTVMQEIYSKIYEYNILSMGEEITAETFDKNATNLDGKSTNYYITVTVGGRMYNIHGDRTARHYRETHKQADDFLNFVQFMDQTLSKTPEFNELFN